MALRILTFNKNFSMTRSEQLLAIRPHIPSAKFNEAMSLEERFQNATLRPVIKLQNDLLVEVFKNYANKHKQLFYNLSTEKQIDYIENAMQKNMKFRNSVKGIIIGQFTVEEYTDYVSNSSALNKRMLTIITERLISNLQVFETQLA